MQKDKLQFIALFAIVALLNILLLTGISKYGLGLEVDSANYFSAAQSLSEGKGFLQFDEFNFLNAPPLYPILLSIGYFLGIPIQVFAGWLQFVFFNLSLYFLYSIIRFRLQINNYQWALFLAGGFYYHYVHVLLFALSEAGFVAFLLVWVNESLKEKEQQRTWLLAILLVMLSMQRYILWLLLPGIIWFWFKQKEKLRRMILMLLPAGLVSASWWYRNYSIAGSFFGGHDIENKIDLASLGINSLRLIGGVITHFNLFASIVVFLFLLLLSLGFFKLLPAKHRLFCKLILPLSGSLLLLLFLQSGLSMVQLPRYISVLWPLVLIILPIVLESIHLRPWLKKLLIAGILIPHTFLLCKHIYHKSRVGAGGFHSDFWQNQARMQLDKKVPEGKLMSNFPDMVWWMSNKHCLYSPFKGESKEIFDKRSAGTEYLIWFDIEERKQVMNMIYRKALKKNKKEKLGEGVELYYLH